MDKNKLQVVDSVKQFARFCGAVQDLAALVGDVDSFEREANDIESRLQIKRQEIQKIDEQTKAAQVNWDAAVEGHKSALEAAAKVKADANTEKDKMLAEAKAKARGIEAEANAKADSIIAEAEKVGKDIDASFNKKRQELVDIDSQIAARNIELKEVQAKLEELRATISRIASA